MRDGRRAPVFSIVEDERSHRAGGVGRAGSCRQGDATAWIATNACPDLELGSRVAAMLRTCAEVALTAQRAITHPSGDIDAVFDRLSNLVAIIEIHSHALDNW
jgi:hypothetical protein